MFGRFDDEVSDVLFVPAEETPVLIDARRLLQKRKGRKARSTTPVVTMARRYLKSAEKEYGEAIQYQPEAYRSQTRGECATMPRPCPFVSCAHHLYLDVNAESGAIKLNYPHLDVHQMEESCALDVADRGGTTLEEVGAMLSLTRERIRQIEVRGLAKIREQHGEELGVDVAATQ